MTPKTTNVKRRVADKFLDYIEAHPRLGWYIAAMATLNVLLNLVDAFDLF